MSGGVDVAVVGAGVVGSAIAWECARRGARVAIVDAGRPGAQASGAAAGMLAPASEAHGPGPFLELGLRSLAMWPGFAAEVEEASAQSCHLRLHGLLRVAADSADAAAVRGRLQWQRAAGVEAAWLPSAAARELEPAWSGDGEGAGWYPGEGHVDSPRVVAALVRALSRAGARLHAEDAVEGLTAGGGLRLHGGCVVEAGTCVVAAGAWSGEVAARLGAPPVPIAPVRGQLLALRGLAASPRRVLFSGLRGYAVGKDDGRVLVGATEEDAGFDATPTAAATERLLAVASGLLRARTGSAEVRAWAGLRPRTPDGLPALGELERSGTVGPRVLVATGHHRNGVLLAPATAAGIAELALGGAAPAGWAAFDPARFRPGGSPH